MRKLLILIILCLPVVVWAQDMRKITGRVLEAASGEPLPGATVFIDPDAPEAKAVSYTHLTLPTKRIV